MEDLFYKEAFFFCCCIFASFQSQNSYTSVTRWVEVNSPDEGSETVEMGLWLWNDIKENHVRETWLLPTLCRKDAKWKQTHKNNVEKEQVKPVKVMFSKGKKKNIWLFLKSPVSRKIHFQHFRQENVSQPVVELPPTGRSESGCQIPLVRFNFVHGSWSAIIQFPLFVMFYAQHKKREDISQ